MVDTCFLDLDGVLVDFVGGALKLHGRELPYEQTEWNFQHQLGIPAEEFWPPMGHDFWAGLEWTADGKEILAGLEDIFETIVILTSPIDTPGAVEGKMAWIRREMPAYTRRFFVGPPKQTIASETKLLIDDHTDNVSLWRAAGGPAVLVPRPWNIAEPSTVDELLDFISWVKVA